VGFEPTRERNPLPVFKTGALNHSATLPTSGINDFTLIPKPAPSQHDSNSLIRAAQTRHRAAASIPTSVAAFAYSACLPVIVSCFAIFWSLPLQLHLVDTVQRIIPH
jgi:hypothetical protein